MDLGAVNSPLPDPTRCAGRGPARSDRPRFCGALRGRPDRGGWCGTGTAARAGSLRGRERLYFARLRRSCMFTAATAPTTWTAPSTRCARRIAGPRASRHHQHLSHHDDGIADADPPDARRLRAGPGNLVRRRWRTDRRRPPLRPLFRARTRSAAIRPTVGAIPTPTSTLSYCAGGMVRIATCAAELPGAESFYAAARERGCLVTCGHSNATWTEMARAFRAGMRHVDHFWCAMSSVSSLRPRFGSPMQASMEQFVLAHPEMSTEVIADGATCRPSCSSSPIE